MSFETDRWMISFHARDGGHAVFGTVFFSVEDKVQALRASEIKSALADVELDQGLMKAIPVAVIPIRPEE